MLLELQGEDDLRNSPPVSPTKELELEKDGSVASGSRESRGSESAVWTRV